MWIWSGADNKTHRVTDEFFRANTPAWDPEGNYLYFLSVHDFAPLISQVEFNFALNRSAGIFVTVTAEGCKTSVSSQER